jgi:hypothetical protein
MHISDDAVTIYSNAKQARLKRFLEQDAEIWVEL